MRLTFINTSSAKCRHFQKIESLRSRYEYLLKGEILAKRWIDVENYREFYRPSLNGVFVMEDLPKIKKFTTVKTALKEGQRLRKLIQLELAKLN